MNSFLVKQIFTDLKKVVETWIQSLRWTHSFFIDKKKKKNIIALDVFFLPLKTGTSSFFDEIAAQVRSESPKCDNTSSLKNRISRKGRKVQRPPNLRHVAVVAKRLKWKSGHVFEGPEDQWEVQKSSYLCWQQIGKANTDIKIGWRFLLSLKLKTKASLSLFEKVTK